jgi:pimeloyl-ACP methyl ester carboxylesterase
MLAGDILRLLDRLGIEKTVLAGHSMGGYVSLAFARSYPDRLAGLALVTSQAAADPTERKEGRYLLANEVEKGGVLAVVEANLERYSPKEDVLARTREIMLGCNPVGVAAALRGMAERYDLTSFLPAIDIPSLVITGEVDALISPERGIEAAKLLPQAQLVTVAGGGHMPMLEAPETVASALRELMRRSFP